MSRTKTCIVIVGPTAVGKTSLAIQLAQLLNTHIISADSRQCFQELNIGVAKPNAEQLAAVRHYFINSHSITDETNAVVFESYALAAANDIFLHHDTAVLVGGTGLYVKAFCEGMDAIPQVPLQVRQEIIENYRLHGLPWLQKEVELNDREYFLSGETQNPQRLMRALEVKAATGISIKTYQAKEKVTRPFSILKLGVELPREQLYRNINLRVDQMFEQGLEYEAKGLLPYAHYNALQTVGYRELFDYFAGKETLPAAIDTIKKNTRHYAKRQLTWFKKDKQINWFAPGDIKLISNLLAANEVFPSL